MNVLVTNAPNLNYELQSTNQGDVEVQAVPVSSIAGGAPPLGASGTVTIDDSSFVVPGTNRSTTQIDVVMGGKFVAGTRLLLSGVVAPLYQDSTGRMDVVVDLQTSIDGGVSWQSSGFLASSGTATGWTFVPMPILGQLDFTVAPLADTVSFRYLLTNDNASTSGVLFNQGDPSVNPRISFQLVTAP